MYETLSYKICEAKLFDLNLLNIYHTSIEKGNEKSKNRRVNQVYNPT